MQNRTHVQFLPRRGRLLGPILLKEWGRVEIDYCVCAMGKLFHCQNFDTFCLCVRRPWKIIPANCRYASQTQGFSIGGKIPLFTLDLSRCAINSICYASILALSGIKHQRRCAQQTKQIKTYSFDAVLIAARTKNPVLMATTKVHGARPQLQLKVVK